MVKQLSSCHFKISPVRSTVTAKKPKKTQAITQTCSKIHAVYSRPSILILQVWVSCGYILRSSGQVRTAMNLS